MEKVKVAKWFKVLITELGEVLKSDDLDTILDSIVENYQIPVSQLLDRVCIIEIQDMQGYVGGTLGIREQFELISDYMTRRGA